jgi:AcrR family transcriptional regulator
MNDSSHSTIRIREPAMPRAGNPSIAARKTPRQQRSMRLVADILEAAIRILRAEGAARFTMARVAEKAGVSVGSLYQYFPNKEAILFRLQTDEWTQTTGLLEGILADRTRPPRDRLRAAVTAFFHSECDEAALRVALTDAAPLYRDAPESRAHRKEANARLAAFMREALPGASAKERALAGDIVMTTMSAVGKAVSEQGRTRAAVEAFAAAVGTMLCAYLDGLDRTGSIG